MLTHCTATAHANIALVKYWGKRGPGNAPATPSIGLCLDALTTTTTVARTDARRDSVRIGGMPATGAVRARVAAFLEHWRGAGLLAGHFAIDSANNFPTAAGLASSSSAYAALALALSGFATAKLTPAALSRLARRGSGSAARSIHGGLACLEATDDPASQPLCPAGRTPFGMVVCIVDAPAKNTSSRDGMRQSAEHSPYYDAWVAQAEVDYLHLRGLLAHCTKPGSSEVSAEAMAAIGAVVEANCLAMHACMQATRPPLLYWAPGTLSVLQALRDWRAAGLQAYFTIDAGAHVALLCLQRDLAVIAQRAAQVPGVRQALPCKPGGPARIIERG